MKKLLVFPAILFLINFCACGPGSAQRIQIQKAHDDSIKTVMSNRYASQSEIKEALYKLTDLQQKLAKEKTTLKSEIEKINKLRNNNSQKTNSAQAIAAQQLVIQAVKNEISNLDQEINQTRDRITAIKLETQKYN